VQEIDEGEGVEKVAVLIGQRRLQAFTERCALSDAQRRARAAEVQLWATVGGPGRQRRR
jgi:hypothetical protein